MRKISNEHIIRTDDDIVIRAELQRVFSVLVCSLMMMSGIGMIIALGITHYLLASVFIMLFALVAFYLACQIFRFWEINRDGVKARMLFYRRFFPWDQLDTVENSDEYLIFRRKKSWFPIRIPKYGLIGVDEPVIERNVLQRATRLVESIERGGLIEVVNYAATRWRRFLVVAFVCWLIVLARNPNIWLDAMDWSFWEIWRRGILIIATCVLVLQVVWHYKRKELPLRLDTSGIALLRGRAPLEIAWEDVTVTVKGSVYTLRSGKNPDWKFLLRDSMTNYHAARLLLRSKGLIPE